MRRRREQDISVYADVCRGGVFMYGEAALMSDEFLTSFDPAVYRKTAAASSALVFKRNQGRPLIARREAKRT